jgi:hypothetical protein
LELPGRTTLREYAGLTYDLLLEETRRYAPVPGDPPRLATAVSLIWFVLTLVFGITGLVIG